MGRYGNKSTGISLALAVLLASPAAWPDDAARAADGAQSADDDRAPVHVVMHKNPGCGCCDIWADHLRAFGMTVETTEDWDILNFKRRYGIPRPLMSCHTAVIDGYFFEGHVPAADILRLLREKPRHVTGLAVPGMPLGSPGMEHPRPQDFNTIALYGDGNAAVFESHAAGEDFSPLE